MMKVKDLMSKKVTTVTPGEMLDRVVVLLNFEGIRHLPVVDKGKVVGMITDRDVKKILGPRNKQVVSDKDGSVITVPARKVHTAMSRKIYTIGPEDTAGDAAAIMAKRKIGGLPVVKKGKIVGIITATDILRAFVKLVQGYQKMERMMNMP